ncbi:hypothetical protein Tco_0896542 [Tanacetum coccineum]
MVVQNQVEMGEDEAVCKELDDSLVRAATTAPSLEAEQDSGVNTPQSDEDSMKLMELMDFCTKLQQRVLDLENTKTAQAQEITSLKLRVKKLEKKGGSRTHKLKRLYKDILDKEVVAIDVIPLATKPPTIVDWKIHKEGKNRQDLKDLYKLVKDKYGSTRPVEDLDLILYRDLKTMFDPYVEDQVWKNQQDYKVLDWKLYDSCGVHSLRM